MKTIKTIGRVFYYVLAVIFAIPVVIFGLGVIGGTELYYRIFDDDDIGGKWPVGLIVSLGLEVLWLGFIYKVILPWLLPSVTW